MSSFNFPHSNKTRAELANSVGNKHSSLCLSFCSNDGSLHFFFTFEDQVLGLFRLLLSNLLGFNGSSEVSCELEVSNGDVIQDDSKLFGSDHQFCSYLVGHLFSFRNQLLCIVLSNNGLEYFIADGRNDTFVVISSDIVQDLM